MNILSKIKTLFSKNTQEIISQQSSAVDENSITFAIDGFGRPWISIEMGDVNDKSCENFAKMLFHINNGGYEQSMLDLLVSLAKDKPELALALETTLISWGMLLATAENDPKNKLAKSTENRPFIRPRNVFLGTNK